MICGLLSTVVSILCLLIPTTPFSISQKACESGSSSRSSPASSHNLTENLLTSWPQPPVEVEVMRNMSVIFDSYGRTVNAHWSHEVKASLDGLVEYFNRKGILSGRPMLVNRGVIQFGLGLTMRGGPVRGRDISTVLILMEELYFDRNWGIREITSAQIKMGSPKVAVGAFQVLFKDRDVEDGRLHRMF